MCGIAGLVSLDGRQIDHAHLACMSTLLAHRGPDDHGIYLEGAAGLAHRRLAIIDCSPAGHGPMPNEDETLWITYNGEVYNYRELMPDLQARGHRFRSVCDTEVVLHAYEEYGEACVERFNGMFAFAIWDARRGTLFCARDRCGVKPFYYVHRDGSFAFASEIKALLALPWVRRCVNQQAVFDYLVHGYVDHTDRTFFEEIHALPAAHTLKVDRSVEQPRRYWSLPAPDPETLAIPMSRRERTRRTEEFGALLEDSVRLRLRSDVAVGSCLSGGLDSSTIVCLVNRMLFAGDAGLAERWHARGERQKTFTACFAEQAIDERPYVEQVIARTGAAPHWTYPQGTDLVSELERVVWHQDEPFLSTSIVAQWYVMRLARQTGVIVLLDGQGADELLCGYAGYYGAFFADLLRAGRLADLSREMALYQRYHGGRWEPAPRQLARTLRARHGALRPRLRSRLDPERMLPDWLAPGMLDAAERTDLHGWSPGQPGYLPAMAAWLFAHGSLPALLRYEDRNSMAFGVEARVPYLDYRLVEWVFRAPNAVRFGDGLNKRILREATRGVIPEPIRRRRDKLGFTTPEADWLRGPARQAVEAILAAPSLALRGYLRPDRVQEVCAAFMNGTPIDSTLIWRWVCLELWHRGVVER